MMMGRQPYAERSREEMGGRSGEGSPVSLASTIDHKNLWKYKPDALQQEDLNSKFQQKKLSESFPKNES